MKPKRRYVTLEELLSSGTIRPPLHLEGRYGAHKFSATITAHGELRFLGRSYRARTKRSPLSTVAGVALSAVRPTPPGHRVPPADGWLFWKFRDAEGRLRPMTILRERHLRRGRA